MAKKPQFSHKDTATKQDIVDLLYNEIGYNKKYSAELVDFCFDTIKNQLSSGKNVKISKFGHFILRNKKARIGRDPATGATMTIPKRKVVTFRASALLKEKVR